jgi:hypothetical protein
MATRRPKAVAISASAIPAHDARRPPAAPPSRHRLERVHDADRGAEQTDERRRRADGAQHARAALELGEDDHHLALHRALGRVDVGGGDGGTVTQQRLHLGQGAAEHARDVALLVLLGQRDGLVEVLFLDGARELRRELPRRASLFLILRSFWNAMVREYTDMIASTMTMNFAKPPDCSQRCIRSTFIGEPFRGGVSRPPSAAGRE